MGGGTGIALRQQKGRYSNQSKLYQFQSLSLSNPRPVRLNGLYGSSRCEHYELVVASAVQIIDETLNLLQSTKRDSIADKLVDDIKETLETRESGMDGGQMGRMNPQKTQMVVKNMIMMLSS
ncbi:MAG: hypothetical protein EZS28_022283 [Streblomastix strix]|uniref:Uncharacterized protein n=1 Tax=Streblomastix strix TaxID=222440 RepID=A0A5J4VI60_9EUKA|nr:MAG: hypothetical protein EZS28_022283 [Streblomastix strix]